MPPPDSADLEDRAEAAWREYTKQTRDYQFADAGPFIAGYEAAQAESAAKDALIAEMLAALKACLLEDERLEADGNTRSDMVCGAIEVAVLYGGGLATSSPEQHRLHKALAALTGADPSELVSTLGDGT